MVWDMKILVIADDLSLLKRIEAELRHEEFGVDSAHTGESALFQAHHEDYTAIILDVSSPRLLGWDLLARLRGRKITPVLLLISREQIRDRLPGLDFGVNDYVVKPVDHAEVLARLQTIIHRQASRPEGVLDLGELQIDLAARLVTRNGRKVELTPREYRMVEFFALRRGQVVTRSQLFEHLADTARDTGSNLLDVHVFNIRKKLGPEFITTRRGHGYCVK